MKAASVQEFGRSLSMKDAPLPGLAGEAHGVLVTAVSGPAFAQGIGMQHERGTLSRVAPPPGDPSLASFERQKTGASCGRAVMAP